MYLSVIKETSQPHLVNDGTNDGFSFSFLALSPSLSVSTFVILRILAALLLLWTIDKV